MASRNATHWPSGAANAPPISTKLHQNVTYNFGLRESLYKLFTLELAMESPWLEEFACEHEEQLRLEWNCRESSHSTSIRLLDNLLMLSTVRLCSQRDPGGGSHSPRNILKASLFGSDGLTAMETRGWHKLARRRADLSVCLSWRFLAFKGMSLALLYVTITMFAATYALMQKDLIMAHIRPRAATIAANNASALSQNLNESCVILEMPDVELNSSSERHFFQLDSWIAYAGEPVLSLLGVRFLALSVIGYIPISFYCIPLLYVLLYGHRLRLDSLAFLYEPQLEFERLKAEQARLLDELVESFANSCRTAQLAQRKFKLMHPSQRDKLARRVPQHPDNRHFLAIMGELRHRPHLVRPLVVNSEWHYLKQKCAPFLIVGSLLTVMASVYLPTAWASAMELLAQTRQRLRAAQCRKWNSNAVPSLPEVRLAPQTQFEATQYEQHDGSWTHLVYLATCIEFKYHARACLAFWTKQLFVCTLLCVWVTSWSTIYMLAFIDKIAWLAQIRRQLRWCTSMCRLLFAYDHSHSHSHLHPQGACRAGIKQEKLAPNQQQQQQQQQQQLQYHANYNQLMRRLASVYVNYELFRRHYEPFRALANFLIFQVSLFAGAWFMIFYLITVNIESQPKFFMLICSIFIIILFNTYLVLASYMSKLIENLMCQLIRLLALAAEQPQLAVGPTIGIWRRQLLAERELQQFASLRVLGLLVSYRKIIAVNVNIIGIWLLMWKAFTRKRVLE